METLNIKVGASVLTFAFTFLICQLLLGSAFGLEVSPVILLILLIIGPKAVYFVNSNKEVIERKYLYLAFGAGFITWITAYSWLWR